MIPLLLDFFPSQTAKQSELGDGHLHQQLVNVRSGAASQSLLVALTAVPFCWRQLLGRGQGLLTGLQNTKKTVCVCICGRYRLIMAVESNGCIKDGGRGSTSSLVVS